jgi:hypothetical protein
LVSLTTVDHRTAPGDTVTLRPYRPSVWRINLTLNSSGYIASLTLEPKINGTPC